MTLVGERDAQTGGAASQRRHSDTWYITALAATVLIGGLTLIVGYAWATPGSHVRYGSTGLLVATASLTTGAIVGFLLGIPRYVSSGAHRLQGMPSSPSTSSPTTVAHDTGEAKPGNEFAPSTNLAEISDWLTKLLLGAGLVGLTQIGPPLGTLIDSVANGLEDSAATSDVVGSAEVIAGAIICTYLTVGILGGYAMTTFKYRNALNERRD